MSVKTDYNKLASEYGTPFYLFDYDSAINRISQIKQRLPSNAMLCYAIKANTFLVDNPCSGLMIITSNFFFILIGVTFSPIPST